MPTSCSLPIRRLSQQEFGEVSYEVMRQVFAIHNELGRFFDEKIYKRELAHRLPGLHLEVPVDVTFGSFHTRYHLDVLVGDGAIFEFKSVESLSPRHYAQLLNYLLICDVAHGKLVNVRPESVEHEFVNTNWDRHSRTRFEVADAKWNGSLPGSCQLHDFLVSLLLDLGAGLEISLYEEAVVHCFGGPTQVEAEVPANLGGHGLGCQRMRLIGPGVAFKITAFEQPLDSFATHARRLLQHVELRAIAWININLNQITFTSLER